MLFNAGRSITATLIVSLLIQIQIATIGLALIFTRIRPIATGLISYSGGIMLSKSLYKQRLLIFLLIGTITASNTLASNHIPQIAFSSSQNGNRDIYVMGADGENQIRLTKHRSPDNHPSWSPDGKRIAFTSNRISIGGEIYVMDSDGENVIRLTNGEWDLNPAWSPDGKRIVFQSKIAERAEHINTEIFVMDADGRNQTRLTDSPLYDAEPSWSSDSRKIAFVSQRGEGDFRLQIYVMDSSGENQTRLTHDGGSNKREPAWSPDGKSIAFVLNELSSIIKIYVMDSDGKNRRKLTDGRQNWGPAWSPDSELIAYTDWGEPDIVGEIHLMTADGKHLKLLSNHSAWDPDWFDPATLAVAPAGKSLTIWGRLKKLAPNLR